MSNLLIPMPAYVVYHPAVKRPFSEVYKDLRNEFVMGNVNIQYSEDGELEQFTYTKDCVSNRAWNDTTIIARGIIACPSENRFVALPFPKFFNYGEMPINLPLNEDYSVRQKVDGSLIIYFYHDGRWQAATKGSFKSEQAIWAENWIAQNVDPATFNQNYTYLFEAVYKQNRIVVNYDFEGLVILGGYDNLTGEELFPGYYNRFTKIKFPIIYGPKSIAEHLDDAKRMTSQEEGYVIRYVSGLRIKIKGDEYKRVHAIISRITPLGIWEALKNGDDLVRIRKDIPEEFWVDFDKIRDILRNQFETLKYKVYGNWLTTRRMTDKEVGLTLQDRKQKIFPREIMPFVFPYRKAVINSGANSGDLSFFKEVNGKIWDNIRPTGNVLEGYETSYGISRRKEDLL